MYHELTVVFHTRQAAQVTLGWKRYVDDQIKSGKEGLGIWEGLKERLGVMPVE